MLSKASSEHYWMNQEEMAVLLFARMVSFRGCSSQKGTLFPNGLEGFAGPAGGMLKSHFIFAFYFLMICMSEEDVVAAEAVSQCTEKRRVW